MDLARKVASLEAQLAELCAQMGNMASRATLVESDDANGAQRQKLYGFYGEELTDVQLWQPFGLSANCPPGADVMVLAMGGNRDGAQGLAATHPNHRPTGQAIGETALYDAGGQTVTLGDTGITITDRFGSSVSMAAGGAVTIKATSVEITSDSLTHNGKNIGDDHKHLNSGGPSLGGIPS